MKQNEILEQMKRLSSSINNALTEIERQENISFFKTLIQKSSIELYTLAQELTESIPAGKGEIEKPIELIAEIKPQVVKTVSPPPDIMPEKIQKVEAKEIISLTSPEIQKPKAVAEAPELKVSVNDSMSLDNEPISLNEKISKNKVPVMNVSEKSKETPIKDLSKAITISKKFEFISGLFNGNGEAYKTCINSIQESNSYDAAMLIIEPVLAAAEETEETENLATEFFALVRRRFLN